MIGLGGGNTPLVPSARIASALSFKLEFINPTGSYNDQFIQREPANLRSRPPFVLATSSGNTGASLAACAARAGLRCFICAHPEAPAGKLIQMQAHGATVIRIPGFAVDAAITAAVFAELEHWQQQYEVPLIVSVFRYCPAAPQHVFVPVGGGGLYVAVARAFAHLDLTTKVHAVQPAGCPTVVAAWQQGLAKASRVSIPTRISGLSVPSDIDATLALEHLRAKSGLGLAASGDDVWAAQDRLLREPAESAVCLVTRHGAKDFASLLATAERVAYFDHA